MKICLLFIFLFLYLPVSFSQMNHSTFQTWMKGDNTIEQPGDYGNRGVANVSNTPGGRDFSATWRDNNGNLWLFGGYGFDATGILGYLNDLWKYDPSANKWTWIKGDSIANSVGVYGTLGVASPANTPGGVYASVSWSDNSGKLWLFGGHGYASNGFGFLNNLWMYDPATNNWTWIKGNNVIDKPGVYGTQGTAHTNNKPGARYGSRTWTDGNGNLWLFGGYGFDNSTVGNLNDLWKYNPSTNKWTWVNGDNLINQPGVYGQKGTTSAANKPGARHVSLSWQDTNDNLWLMGGYGYAANTDGQLNDLWKYNIATNQWTWVNGDNDINKPGLYGAQGVSDGISQPGSRYLGISWTDANNILWMFGGHGYGQSNEGYLNDLWKYEPASDKWTWIKGDSTVNQVGVYGTQGMATAWNKSGARISSVSWTDDNGHLWFFGGYGYDATSSGMLNDLWKITSFEVLPMQLSYFNGTCKDNTTLLKWETIQELNVSHFAIQRSFDGTHFTTIGALNAKGGIDRTVYNYRDNLDNINEPKIFYRLQLVDANSSFNYSRVIRFDRRQSIPDLQVFPNPASQFLSLSFTKTEAGLTTIQIVNMNGAIVKRLSEMTSEGRSSFNIDISKLPSASYIVTVRLANSTIEQKFVKQ